MENLTNISSEQQLLQLRNEGKITEDEYKELLKTLRKTTRLDFGQQLQEKPKPARTSGLAVTSLVLGILSLFTFFLTAIPAIILGIVALVKISKSAGQLKGNGHAIAGIAVPTALLPIALGIILPALHRAKQMSYRVVCATNLSGLGEAMHIYANDHNNMFPTPSKWCDLLIENILVSQKIFRCQSAPEGFCSYAMNKNVEKLGISAPPDMVLLFETRPGWNQSGGPEILTTENHGGDGCNILFVDAHVEFIKTDDLNNLKWSAE